MKTLKCDLCEHAESVATFEEWMNKLKPHYASAHSDIMKGMGGKSKAEQMAEMQKWIRENKQRFESA